MKKIVVAIALMPVLALAVLMGVTLYAAKQDKGWDD